MNLVAYSRVSTVEQTDGLGLEVQRQAIAAWAAVQDPPAALLAWCSDEGISGSNGLAARDGLADALGHLERPDVDGLIVYRLDRLARDLVVQESLLADIWRKNKVVHSTAGSENDLADDSDDPSRKMIRRILGAVNEYEREIIVLRLKAGRRLKRQRTGWAGGGVPYGWARDGRGGLVPDDAQQAVIDRMRALQAEGVAVVRIVEALNDDGVPGPTGGRWHRSAVRRALQRSV